MMSTCQRPYVVETFVPIRELRLNNTDLKFGEDELESDIIRGCPRKDKYTPETWKKDSGTR